MLPPSALLSVRRGRFHRDCRMSRMSSSTVRCLLAVLLLLFLEARTTALAADAKQGARGAKKSNMNSSKRIQLRWTGTGGGWRSMVAHMGFTVAFAKAGLIDRRGTLFDGISTNSGSAWFGTQFFYSKPFFDRLVKTTLADPDNAGTNIYSFVQDWMMAYRGILKITPNSRCQSLAAAQNIPGLDSLYGACFAFAGYNNWDWGTFVQTMFNATSTLAYNDSGFNARTASKANRVSALSKTDLYVQTGITANSRTADGSKQVYLGPSENLNVVYTVPLAVQIAMKANGVVEYLYNTHGTTQSPMVHTAPAPTNYSTADWVPFYLFPGIGGTVLTDKYAGGSPVTNDTVTRLSTPFGGVNPTMAQVNAATSAIVAQVSGSTGSFLVQFASVLYFALSDAGLPAAQLQGVLTALAGVTSALYTPGLFENMAVCTQWPNTCSDTVSAGNVGRLVDGGFLDGMSLAQNLAQYQKNPDGYNSRVRVIITEANRFPDTLVRFLSYFNTTFNQNVAPGGWIWAPGISSTTGLPNQTPWRSQQIFAEKLNATSFLSNMDTIAGINVTTGYFVATTLNNDAFGVKAGLTVEILVIRLNSYITTDIFSVADVDANTVPLATMAKEIAESDELISRVADFSKGKYVPYTGNLTCCKKFEVDCGGSNRNRNLKVGNKNPPPGTCEKVCVKPCSTRRGLSVQN